MAAAQDVLGDTPTKVAEAAEAKRLAIEFLVARFQDRPAVPAVAGVVRPASRAAGTAGGGAALTSEEIRLVLHSVADNASFLRTHRDPVAKMLGYLKHCFSPLVEPKHYSLSLRHGKGGSKLTHDHGTQFRHARRGPPCAHRSLLSSVNRITAHARRPPARAPLVEQSRCWPICATAAPPRRRGGALPATSKKRSQERVLASHRSPRGCPATAK